MKLTLAPITATGDVDGLDREELSQSPFFSVVIQSMREHYRRVGWHAPWIGYLAVTEDAVPQGVGGFKSIPTDGRVEIAYAVDPEHEGRGVGTALAKSLVALANSQAPEVLVFAQTLPEPNASTTILTKVGFEKTRELHHLEDGLVWEWELKGDC